VTATPVDVCGRSNTIQHDDPSQLNTQQHAMDVSGRIGTKVARTSKPLVGILGDVDGRIVPVAPPPVSEFEIDVTTRPTYVIRGMLAAAEAG
jgi:hypothetical protein